MRDGSISALLVEAICLDVVEALALVIEDDARVRIRCGRMDFDAESGVVKAKRAIVDTTDSILLARGQADLSVETLDFEVEARAKNFSLIDATAPVSLSGTFDEPDIANGGLDPLPFLEMGDAEDVDCARLLSGRADQLGPDGTPADD